MTPGDLADHLTILNLKLENAPSDPEFRRALRKEFDLALHAWNLHNPNAEAWRCALLLAVANSEIWTLESSIRMAPEGVESLLDLEEVGKRALAIRKINKHRVWLKNKINALYGAFQDRKIKHASEDSQELR